MAGLLLARLMEQSSPFWRIQAEAAEACFGALPGSIHEERGYVLGQVFSEQRQGLPFAADQIRGDAHQCVPGYRGIQDHLSGEPFASGHFNFYIQPEIAWSQRVRSNEAERETLIRRDDTTEDDIGLVMGRQFVSSVTL